MKEFSAVFPKRIKIVETTPEYITNAEIFSYRKCYVAISLGNLFFETYKLDMLMHWVAKRFESCIILVADSLYRYNIKMQECEDDIKALQLSKIKAGKLISSISKKLKEFPEGKFQLKIWDDYRLREDFEAHYKVIQYTYENNALFRTSVLEDANTYISRIINRGDRICVDEQTARELSISFIQEECAVFSMVTADGFLVDISPDTYLSVLKDIASGKIKDAPETLRKKTIVKIKSVAK
mgnify:CR=1 FL=1